MNTPRWEELQIKDDFMFGVIMSNPEICRLTLERILGVPIEKIEYLEKQKYIAVARDRHAIRLDVYVKDDKGTVYNVEMQTSSNDDLAMRSRYYQGIIDLNLISAGDGYSDLKDSCVIFICTFDPFGKGRYNYTFRSSCQQDPSLQLGDRTTKIFLNTKGTKDDVDEDVKRFLRFIDKASDPDPTDELLVKMHQELLAVRLDEKWKVEYMKYQLELDAQYKRGKQEGIAEGRISLIQKVIKKIHKGQTAETSAEALEEDLSVIQSICDIALSYEYDAQKIYKAIYEK